MNDAALDLHSMLAARGALLKGHFRLSSGRHSDRYIQKFRILEDPALLEPIGRAIAQEFHGLRPTLVVSAAVGGILLGYEVARQLGVKAIFVEKEDGVPVLRRGFSISRDDRVLVVEDVITTGGSVREVIDLVRAAGAQVVGVGAIVNRSTLSTFDSAEGDSLLPARALLDLPLLSYDPDECPSCGSGEPLSDPGSRRL